MTRTALVAGATGVVGRAILAHLESQPGWQVVAAARRPVQAGPFTRTISLDLADPHACRARLADLGPITHVFYTAYAPASTLGQEAKLNARLLVNLVEALEDRPDAASLDHIQLMQGSKWYGNHLGPYRTPARENDPRHGQPCFYYNQQDWLAERRRGKSWTWSALRPHGVLGLAIGSSMNQLTAMAIYASIMRERGETELAWPGAPGAFTCLYQFTEAAYLARGMVWAATSYACSNRALNFTNGDLVRWQHLWPDIAAAFGMKPGPVRTVRLAELFADADDEWSRIVSRHGLKSYRVAELTNWSFADFVFGCAYDQISDLTRARNAGWTGANPSPAMYIRLIEGLREARIIP